MIKGKKITLKAVETEDLDKLKDWRNNPIFRKNFREHRDLNSLNQELWHKKMSKSSSDYMFSVFENKTQNLKDVANELGSRYIVEGSVRKGGNRLRITAQLIDAQGDHHIWSEKWDRTIEDIFDVQDEVSEAIARRVAPSVTGNELKRLSRIRPKNLSAWEEYLQGLKYFNDRNYSDKDNQGLKESCKHFENAIKLDETLSDAFAYLALCGFWDLVHFTSEDSIATLDIMKTRGRKAETLNPENPLALVGLAAPAALCLLPDKLPKSIAFPVIAIVT